VGDFGVETPGSWEELERHALRYRGEFVLGERPKTIRTEHIEQQGFPFFAGQLTLEKEIEIPEKPAVFSFERLGIQAGEVSVADQRKKLLTENEMAVDQPAENQLMRLVLTNNLRNMLGPHHLKEGETYLAAPQSFYKEPCVWNLNPEESWDEDYCFVETTLRFRETK
jgi:hypothetical protein